jgi:hypothetical protein
MSDDREHKVRERAYALWETEGRPSGRHEEHWHRANSEFPVAPVEEAAPGETTPPTAAKPKQPRRKPATARPAAAEAPSAVDAAAPRKRRTLKPKAN